MKTQATPCQDAVPLPADFYPARGTQIETLDATVRDIRALRLSPNDADGTSFGGSGWEMHAPIDRVVQEIGQWRAPERPRALLKKVRRIDNPAFAVGPGYPHLDVRMVVIAIHGAENVARIQLEIQRPASPLCRVDRRTRGSRRSTSRCRDVRCAN
jgi:hypothetical protein